jgi:hypothetical protein
VQAFGSCSTQQIPRVPPLIHYRVLLRTLSSAIPPRVWTEPSYDSVQSAEYVSDPLHPGFKRLRLTDSPDTILDEKLIFEGSSQTDARHFQKTLSFEAHTFDWWIPVKPIPGVSDTAHIKKEVPAVSAKSHMKFPLGVPTAIMHSGLNVEDRILKDTLNSATVTLGLGWEDGGQTWEGRHREMAKTSMQLRVTADWQADKLRVMIDNNRVDDRNYVLFLVIEETFGSVEADEHAPKVLHTSFSVAINGQLTFVPQSFFDEEAAASSKLKDFLSHYAASAKPKVGDPIETSARLGELATDAGVERFTAALQQFEPDTLKQLIHRFEGHKEAPKATRGT